MSAAVLALAGITGCHSTSSSSASPTAGCPQINQALDQVFSGSYADLPAAQTTGDLINNFLSGGNNTSAMVSIMAEKGTAPALRAAESKLNADVSTLVNTSYVSSAQSAVRIPDLKAISGICGKAAWTSVTLKVETSTPNGPPSATPSPSPSAPPSPSSPAPAPSSAPAPSPAFQPQTLLVVSGSGDDTTGQFTVPSSGSGDYDVYWTYSEGSFGQSVNFNFTGDGGSDFNVIGPNQLGTGGSGVTHVYNDAGTHSLEVLSEGDWTIKVVTAP